MLGVPYPAEAQQLLGFVGTQELPQGHAVSELAPSEGLQEKDICGCEGCPWSLSPACPAQRELSTELIQPLSLGRAHLPSIIQFLISQ